MSLLEDVAKKTIHNLDIKLEKLCPISTEKNWKINSIIQFTKVESVVENLSSCYEIQVDKDGNIWALDYDVSQMIKIDWASNTCTKFSISIIFGPLGLAFSPFGDDTILVSCQNSEQVVKFEKSTGEVSDIEGMRNLGNIRGLAFDSQLNLYLTGVNLPLRKFSCRDGLDKITQIDQLKAPPKGRVYTVRVNPLNDDVSYYESSVVCKVVNNQLVNQYLKVTTLTGDEDRIQEANGMCFFGNHLMIADEAANCIRVVDLKTDKVETLDIGLPMVNSISVDQVANILYAANEHTIWRLTFDSYRHKLFKAVPPKTSHYCDIVILTTRRQ